VVVNGRIVRTVMVEDTIRTVVTVDKASSVDLPGPVKGAWSASWSGVVYDDNGPVSLPEITLRGSTVSFGRAVTGMLSVGYRTEYDLVTVRINGMDGEPQDGALLAFYHGMVIEGTVDRPDGDDQVDRSLCSSSTRYHDDEKPICYKLVHRLTKCQCSEQEVSRETVRVEVQCPDGSMPGEHLEGSETVTVARVDCGEEDANLYDRDFYESVCCHPPKVGLPKCAVKKSVFTGGKGIDGGAQKYRSLYGDNVRLVPVSPQDGICGITETRQVVPGNNCCQGVSPIEFADPYITVAPDSYFSVTVSGGKEPFSWHAGGDFGLISSRGSTALFKTLPSFCGTGSVHVDDVCGNSGIINVLSTAGEWILVPEYLYDKCDPPGGGYIVTGDNSGETVKSSDGRYLAQINMMFDGFYLTCEWLGVTPPCSTGARVAGGGDYGEKVCSGYSNTSYETGCCTQSQPGSAQQFLVDTQYVYALWEWSC